MTRINLLPWRDTQRKERQRQFVSVAVSAVVLMVVIIGYIHFHVGTLISKQEARNAFLDQEVVLVDEKITEIKELKAEKKKLLARMNIIQELQSRRPEIVHIFDEIVRRVPDGLFLTSINQAGNKMVLKGVSQSNSRVSTFMKNLHASAWLENPVLEVIESKEVDSVRTSLFTLNINQTSPNKLADEESTEAET